MRRSVLSLAAALSLVAFASVGTLSAAEPNQVPEATNSATASQLALDLRACNHLDAGARDACKTEARQNHTYPAQVPFRPDAPFSRQDN